MPKVGHPKLMMIKLPSQHQLQVIPRNLDAFTDDMCGFIIN